jgi:hypothetical protein
MKSDVLFYFDTLPRHPASGLSTVAAPEISIVEYSLMLRSSPFFATFCVLVSAQEARFPLESIALEGTTFSKEPVLELAGWETGKSWATIFPWRQC